MNIAMLLDMAADGIGDRVAFGPRDGGVTYRQLRELAWGIARELEPHGVDSLATLSETSRATAPALFGAAWAGITYAPLNYRLPEAAQQGLLERLQPAHRLPADLDLDRIRTTEPVAYPDAPQRPAVILFTSGTTAEPKAAVLQHDQLLAYILNTVEFAAAGDDEALLSSVPPFHIAGVASLLSSTYTGRRVVPLPRFSAEAWVDTARRETVTHAFVVPTMLSRIVAALDADENLSVPSLRHLAYGGARMPTPVVRRALALFPDTAFVNAYGLTETSSTVCVLGAEDHRAALDGTDEVAIARLASVGRPVQGIDLRIVDADGHPVATGVSGQVLVRGQQVSGEYVGIGRRVDADGWLHTGDRGSVDAEGYVFIEGRDDDTIIRGGENIAPAEIEDALLRHPEVASAAVVGLPDEDWGARVGAMVTPRTGAVLDLDELRAFTREQLGSLKAPEVLVVSEDIPQTDTGKILRRSVRARLLEIS